MFSSSQWETGPASQQMPYIFSVWSRGIGEVFCRKKIIGKVNVRIDVFFDVNIEIQQVLRNILIQILEKLVWVKNL